MKKSTQGPEHSRHIIFSQDNNSNRVTLVCFAGIHGNEKAGIAGLERVISNISQNQLKLGGNFYALKGNLKALQQNLRFLDKDLNRLWTESNIKGLNQLEDFKFSEQREQLGLYKEIKNILERHKGDFVFLDLHTTSSQTNPFITISDSLNNRKLANCFKIPIILGIEEHLTGPLLTFINEFGHTSLGFEAGQHNDTKSITNCESFIWLIMQNLGLTKKDKTLTKKLENLLYSNTVRSGFFEIVYRYSLKNANKFKMASKFKNFDEIEKGQLLAKDQSIKIYSPVQGMVFMPLYQDQGEDGFFIVNKVSRFWLMLSKLIRKIHIYKGLRFLPGVKRDNGNRYSLIVNPKKARFLTREIFHLFGYRAKVKKEGLLCVTKRDRKVRPLN